MINNNKIRLSLFMMILLSLLILTINSATSLKISSNPNYYYSFDTDFSDSSGNDKNLTNNGSVSITSSNCGLGSCANFPGNPGDFLYYFGDSWQGDTGYVVSVWTHSNIDPNSGIGFGILEYADSTDDIYLQPEQYMRNEFRTDSYSNWATSEDDTTDDPEHWVIQWNQPSSTMEFYKNGTLVYNRTGISGNYINVDGGMFVGDKMHYHASYSNEWNGTLDELGIWLNTTLTQADISNLFNNGTLWNPFAPNVTVNYAPVMVSSRIDPNNTAYNDQDLDGYCNASDSNGDTLSYEYSFYNWSNKYLSSNYSVLDLVYKYLDGINVESGFGANAYDQDWSTYSSCSVGCTHNATLNFSIPSITNEVNFTMKVYADSGAYVQAYCYNGTNFEYLCQDGNGGTKVKICALPSRCFNNTDKIVQMRVYSPSAVNTRRVFETNLSYYGSIINESIEQNIGNISSSLTSISDSFILSCRAFDGESYSSWLNSTPTNISVRTTLNIIYNSGDLITTDINITNIDTGESYNITTGTLTIPLSPNIRNFSITSYDNVFGSFNATLNISSQTNLTFNITVNETHNILTFSDILNGNPIENATITITYPSNNTLEITTNSSGKVNFSYIYGGDLEFGDYSYYINKYGYYNITFSDTINVSNIPYSQEYNISRSNLIVNIYDRYSKNLITKNVTVSFIELFNESTETGQVIKDNLTIVGGDYTIYASSDGYKTAIQTITYTNQENLTVDFYLINNTQDNKGTIFVTTKDSFYRDITGARVTLLEYVPSELSFIEVDECISNINAECSVSVELNTKLYYIRATATIDDVLYIAETNTNGEIFTVDNDIRNLIFFTRTDFEISPSTNLVYKISESFTNNISSISVDFFTTDGTALEVCIEYFKEVNNAWVSVTGDTYCLESSSAKQNIDVDVTLNRSNKYKAEVYINQGYNNVLKSFIYPSDTSISEIFDNNFKSAIVMLLWIFALGFSMQQKNITLFFILAIVLSWVELVFFPSFTIAEISVFKTIVSIIGIYIARKRQDSS